MPWALVIAVGLLLANAFFVWAEFALIAARRTQMEALARDGNRLAAVAQRLMSELNLVLAGAQLGITMASLGLGFVAEPAVARMLEGPLEPLPESVANAAEIAIALAIVVCAHMVLGEMVPKNLAIAEPERSARWIAVPFRAYVAAFRPVIVFLNTAANGIVRLFGIEPRDQLVPAHSADEIASMLEVSHDEGVIEAFEHGLLSRTLTFDRLDARAVMIPRPDVVAVPVGSTPLDVERLAVETGYSRFPVYRDGIDDIIGFVHVKDLLTLSPDAAGRRLPPEAIRSILVTPESRLLTDLLGDMRKQRSHLAIVLDEHGGVDGLVTLENVLEELVGEIRDEHDPAEGTVWRLGPRRALTDARLRPDEAARALGLVLPDGDYDTLAGYLMSQLGRVPDVGDEVEHDSWLLRVRRMVGNRIDLVEIVSPPESPLRSADS